MPHPKYSIHFTNYQRSLALAACGVFLFSLKGIFIKLAYTYDVTPTVFMTLRMLFAIPLYFWILLRTLAHLQPRERQALSAQRLILTFLFGLSGYYVASWFDLVGLVYLSASLERIILYSYPSIVLILSALFLGQRLTMRLIMSLVIIYGGLLALFAQDIGQLHLVTDRQQLFGGAMVLLAAIALAVYFIGGEIMMRHMSSQLFTSLAMLSASIGIAIHYSIAYPLRTIIDQPLPVYAYALLVAIVCTVIPSFLLSAGIKYIGATTTSLVGSVGPATTLIVAFIILGETLSMIQWLGFVLIISGIILLGKSKQ